MPEVTPLISEERIEELARDSGVEWRDSGGVEEVIRTAIREAGEAAATTASQQTTEPEGEFIGGVPFNAMNENARFIAHATAQNCAAAIRARLQGK